MIGFIIGELLATAAASAVFIIMFLRGGSHTGVYSDDPNVRAVSRNIVAVSAVWTFEAAGLAAIGVGVPVPLWIFAAAFGAGTLVMVHRIMLLVRARHPRKS